MGSTLPFDDLSDMLFSATNMRSGFQNQLVIPIFFMDDYQICSCKANSWLTTPIILQLVISLTGMSRSKEGKWADISGK
jgi:hypothetical protein